MNSYAIFSCARAAVITLSAKTVHAYVPPAVRGLMNGMISKTSTNTGHAAVISRLQP